MTEENKLPVEPEALEGDPTAPSAEEAAPAAEPAEAAESVAAPAADGEQPTGDGDPETVRIRVRQRTGRVRTGSGSHKKKTTGKRKALVALVVVLALVLVGTLVGAIVLQKGKEHLRAPLQEEESLTVKYQGHEYMYNEDVVSVLIMGIDDEYAYTGSDASCSDANFLITMDTATNAVNVTTVPRDAICEVDVYQDGKYKFTTHTNLGLAYAIDAPKETCAENVVKSVSTIMEGMPVNYYFAMNVHAIEDLAAAVGGVKVTALQTIPGTNIVKGEKITLKGNDAYKYLQYRDIYVDESALDRQARQEQFIQAFINKARKMSVDQLLKVVKTVSDYSITNLGAEEMSYLASCFIAGDKASLEMITLEGTTKSKVYETDGLEHEYIELDEKSVHAAVIADYYKMIN
ncbi:MAG: LCP family protein [Coriobacteriales bacterium]